MEDEDEDEGDARDGFCSFEAGASLNWPLHVNRLSRDMLPDVIVHPLPGRERERETFVIVTCMQLQMKKNFSAFRKRMETREKK